MRPQIMSDEEVLDAVLDAFGRFGYAGASVREICQGLGVSHAMIHRRYGSKQSIWYRAVQHGFERLIADTNEALVAAGTDDAEQLRAILLTFVRVSVRHPGVLRVIAHEGATPGPRLDFVVERYLAGAHLALGAVVDRLVAAGRMRPVATATIQIMLVNGIGSIFSLPALTSRIGTAPEDVEAQAMLAVEAFVSGMLLPP